MYVRSHHISWLNLCDGSDLQAWFPKCHSNFLQRVRQTSGIYVPLAVPIYITGDINLPLIRPDDPSTTQFLDLIASFGLLQHVTQPTHDKGGLLDVVLTRSDATLSKVDVTDVGLSDHLLLTWTASLGRPDPIYHTTTIDAVGEDSMLMTSVSLSLNLNSVTTSSFLNRQVLMTC